MNRRTFLEAGAGALAAASLCEEPLQAEPLIPIIDTHVHLFDTNRPQGVPWPEKTDKVLYKPALPNRYRAVTKNFPVAGIVEVEASPWLEDNQWVLDIAKTDTLIVGTVGNLQPDKPAFGKQLERFHKNPLFRGIRYGNISGYNLVTAVDKPAFIAGLKLVSSAGLSLDSANPDPALVHAIVGVTDAVPDLRVIIDHLAQLTVPTDAAGLKAYESDLQVLSQRPQVFVKISQVLRHVDGKVPLDLGFYRARLEHLWDLFGEDRLIYGSDWPNSDLWAEYPQIFNLAHSFFATKSRAAQEKYFYGNSMRAYRWVARTPVQKKLALA